MIEIRSEEDLNITVMCKLLKLEKQKLEIDLEIEEIKRECKYNGIPVNSLLKAIKEFKKEIKNGLKG